MVGEPDVVRAQVEKVPVHIAAADFQQGRFPAPPAAHGQGRSDVGAEVHVMPFPLHQPFFQDGRQKAIAGAVVEQTRGFNRLKPQVDLDAP